MPACCRQMGELNFAEEVLVGKAEMDDKRQRIQELELQVLPLVGCAILLQHFAFC